MQIWTDSLFRARKKTFHILSLSFTLCKTSLMYRLMNGSVRTRLADEYSTRVRYSKFAFLVRSLLARSFSSIYIRLSSGFDISIHKMRREYSN